MEKIIATGHFSNERMKRWSKTKTSTKIQTKEEIKECWKQRRCSTAAMMYQHKRFHLLLILLSKGPKPNPIKWRSQFSDSKLLKKSKNGTFYQRQYGAIRQQQWHQHKVNASTTTCIHFIQIFNEMRSAFGRPGTVHEYTIHRYILEAGSISAIISNKKPINYKPLVQFDET